MSAAESHPVVVPEGVVAPIPVGDVMLALGDSIAAGIGASHASQGCMAVLAVHLARMSPGLELRNLAVPGETSSSMLLPGGQLDRAEDLLADLGASRVRCSPILLSIGGNDAMEARSLGEDVAFARLAENLDTIFSRLDRVLRRAGDRVAEVMCLQTVYNPFEGSVPGDGTAERLAPRRATRGSVNAVLRAAAARHGVRIAEVSRAFRGRARQLTWVESGDIHPSDAGHRLIAQVYAATAGWPRP
jgi:lysophospholipase L1-like esterase